MPIPNPRASVDFGLQSTPTKVFALYRNQSSTAKIKVFNLTLLDVFAREESRSDSSRLQNQSSYLVLWLREQGIFLYENCTPFLFSVREDTPEKLSKVFDP